MKFNNIIRDKVDLITILSTMSVIIGMSNTEKLALAMAIDYIKEGEDDDTAAE